MSDGYFDKDEKDEKPRKLITKDKEYIVKDDNADPKAATTIVRRGTDYNTEYYSITRDNTTAECTDENKIAEVSKSQEDETTKLEKSGTSTKLSNDRNDKRVNEVLVAKLESLKGKIDLPEDMTEDDVKKLLEMKEVQDALKEYAQEQQEYLVRGAMMRCSCGSHYRRLNLPKCHGVYTNDRPMMNDNDSLPGDHLNVSTFGVCSSGANKSGGNVLLKKDAKRDVYGKKIEDQEGNVKGTPCSPIVVSNWLSAHESIEVGDGKAITPQSFLVCKYEGIIEVVDSGQNEEETLPKK